MATTKLTVTTPEGTFSRRTARTYTHVVVVRESAAYIRQRWQEDITRTTGYRDHFVAQRNAERAAYEQSRLDELVAAPPTGDQGDAWVLGWCGRADLAAKLAATARKETHGADAGTPRYSSIAIYAVPQP